MLSRYPAVSRRLLTVDEYHRMGESRILTEDDRVELIEGELVTMAPIGSEHVAATNALTRLLVMAAGDRGVVSVGNPVRLTQRSEPQPDFAVLGSRDYRSALPRPEDTMLAVEVGDRYSSVTHVSRSEVQAIEALSDVRIAVAKIFE